MVESSPSASEVALPHVLVGDHSTTHSPPAPPRLPPPSRQYRSSGDGSYWRDTSAASEHSTFSPSRPAFADKSPAPPLTKHSDVGSKPGLHDGRCRSRREPEVASARRSGASSRRERFIGGGIELVQSSHRLLKRPRNQRVHVPEIVVTDKKSTARPVRLQTKPGRSETLSRNDQLESRSSPAQGIAHRAGGRSRTILRPRGSGHHRFPGSDVDEDEMPSSTTNGIVDRPSTAPRRAAIGNLIWLAGRVLRRRHQRENFEPGSRPKAAGAA